MFPRVRGFGAITVVIVLVMLATLGVALVTTTTAQQQSAAIDVQSARAYQAARAGIEFGIYQSLVNGTAGCAAANTTIALAGNLAGFRVTVACVTNPHTEGASTVDMFQIAASGCSLSAGTCPAAAPPGPSYVERSLRVSVGSS